MKRMAVYGIIVLAIQLCFSAVVRADEAGEEKISTLFILKNDLIAPQKGEKLFSQTITGYVHYKWFGAGGDFTWTPRKDFLEFKPYITANKGPFYALVGYSGNSLEQKHIQTGGWYLNRFGKLALAVDLRNYWAVNKQSTSYLELWLNAYYPLGERFYVGAENKFIHFWDPKEDHNQFFLGPLLGVYLTKTKTASVYIRPGIAWDITDGCTKRDFFLRGGLKFQF